MNGRDALGPAISWLAHPVSLGGLALLLLNDHVFKPLWPGLVTGKLSDMAGMVMFPPLLAVLIALVLPCVAAKTVAVVALVLTGCGFSLAKLFGYVAGLASELLSVVVGPSILRADPWDLVALPALGLAWLAFRRAAVRTLSSREARLVRLVVLLPLALLGSSATSCGAGDIAPPAVGQTGDGTVWLRFPQPRPELDKYLVSDDGGRTFRDDEPIASDLPVMREQRCFERNCYRAVRGQMHVQESRDGGETWKTAWKLDEGRYRDLTAKPRDCATPRGAGYESQALVVIERPNGHEVLVSNGFDGLLRREVDGTWHRVAVVSLDGSGGNYQPGRLSQGVIPGGTMFFAVAGSVLFLIFGWFIVTALKAEVPRRLGWWTAGFAVGAAAGAYLNSLVIKFGDTGHPAFVIFVVAWSVAVLGLGLWLAAQFRSVLHAGATTVFVLVVALLAYIAEAMRFFDFFLNVGDLGRIVVLFLGFIGLALTGIFARRWPVEPPRQTG